MSEGMIYYDLKRVKWVPGALTQIRRRGGKVSIPLKKWGAYMLQETGRTFDKKGRGPVRWAPLSPYTLKRRELTSGRTNPRKILREKGPLSSRFKDRIVEKGPSTVLRIWSPLPYARKHQFGGEAVRKATKIVAKGKALAIDLGGGEIIFRKSAFLPRRTFPVPRRRFLFILAADVRRGLEILRVYTAEIIRASDLIYRGGKF